LRTYSISAASGVVLAVLLESQAFAESKPCGALYGPAISTVTVALPEVNRDAEVEVGQTLISAYRVSEMATAMVLPTEKTFVATTLASNTVQVPPQTIPLSVDEHGEKVFVPQTYTVSLTRDGKMLTGLAKPHVRLIFTSLDKRLGAHIDVGFSNKLVFTDPGDTTFKTCSRLSVDGFRREIVYSGVSQGSITLLYREFANDLARPAFSQELHYDLKDGDEIGFKGARIKIISASNVGLKYRVVRPLSD
jgi:hypothetical protein